MTIRFITRIHVSKQLLHQTLKIRHLGPLTKELISPETLPTPLSQNLLKSITLHT